VTLSRGFRLWKFWALRIVIRMTQHVPPFAAKARPQLAASNAAADEVHAALVALVRAIARSEARLWVAEQSVAGGPSHDEV
jgi:cytochrome b561